MTQIQTERNTGKTGATLASRFRFHAIEVLATFAEQKGWRSGSAFGAKIAFENPEYHRIPGCPHCMDDLEVYRRPKGDEWACCPRCGYTGDVVDLMASKLACTPREALKFLIYQHNIHHVCDEEIERYFAQRAKYQRFAARINERVHQDYSFANPDPEHELNIVSLDRLLDTLDLRQYISDSVPANVNGVKPNSALAAMDFSGADGLPASSAAWKLPAQVDTNFFGVAHYRAVESWFFPELVDPETRVIRPNTSPNCVFHGSGWDLVLVIPLMDVPGHYCGVICIGREGRYPEDYVVRLFREGNEVPTNAGFILPFWSYRAMIAGGRSGGRKCLIAYNNPLHLIRTLLRSCWAFPSIPLIGWVDHFEREPYLKTGDWSAFNETRKIFWCQTDDIRVTRTAVEQNGSLIVYDMQQAYPDLKEPYLFGSPRFRPQPQALMQMERDAIHWTRYLGNRFKGMAPEDAVALLSQITLTPELFGTVLAQLPHSPQAEAMRKAARRYVQPCNINVGRYEIYDEAAGLFRKAPKQKSPTFVTDVRCFLDELFHNSKRTRMLYRGRILYKGETLGFTAKVRDFDKKPIAVIRANIEDAGLPDPTFHCKDRFLREVIFKMSRLKKIVPVRAIGWNDKSQAFVFPQFRVKSHKIIRTMKHALLSDDGFPCKYMDPPDGTYSTEMELLSDSTAVAPFLAVVTLMALRPYLGLPSYPVVISGDCEIKLWTLAASLGVPIGYLNTKEEIKSLRQYNAQHRWPIMVRCVYDDDMVKLRRLKMEDFCYTLFHIADTKKARLFANTQANIIHVPLKKSQNSIMFEWQSLLPAIKSFFFERLQNFLRDKPNIVSDRAFLRREIAYCNAEFNPFEPEGDLSADYAGCADTCQDNSSAESLSSADNLF